MSIIDWRKLINMKIIMSKKEKLEDDIKTLEFEINYLENRMLPWSTTQEESISALREKLSEKKRCLKE